MAVRIVSDKMKSELTKNDLRPMGFAKRPMKAFVYLSQEGYKTEALLLYYIEIRLEQVKIEL